MTQATTNQVAGRLERLRVEGGAVALGRVLTLVIMLDGTERLDEAIDAADAASLEHPCRVLALCVLPDAEIDPPAADDDADDAAEDASASVTAPADDGARRGIDAEIRVGGDAGASETVIVRLPEHEARDLDALLNPLLLPDAPIVAWWPGQAPAVPADDPIGAIATRRIIDSHACGDPIAALRRSAAGYRPGDTDLSWTRITLWRAQLAAAFEEVEDVEVTGAAVSGNPRHPSCRLLLGWLTGALGCPGAIEADDGAAAITGARITWRGADPAGDRIALTRPDGADVATLTIGTEIPHDVALQLRTLPECLAEELRRLDPDEVYGQVITALDPQGAPQ